MRALTRQGRRKANIGTGPDPVLARRDAHEDLGIHRLPGSDSSRGCERFRTTSHGRIEAVLDPRS